MDSDINPPVLTATYLSPSEFNAMPDTILLAMTLAPLEDSHSLTWSYMSSDLGDSHNGFSQERAHPPSLIETT